MTDQTIDLPITFEPPDEHAPGYLRRVKIVARLNEAGRSKQISADLLDELVEVTAEFITEIDGQPCTAEQAQEVLWNLSEAQWGQASAHLVAGKSRPPNGEPSDAPSEESAD